MIEHSNLIATAWDGQLLIGIARSVTDFHYCCYLSDLAVDVAYQRRGVGRRLIQTTQDALGPRCNIILLSAPAAVSYYPHLGFKRHDQAWILPRLKRVQIGAEPDAAANGGSATPLDNPGATQGLPSVS
jgi:GNAT superfamily N-acetyltransferase